MKRDNSHERCTATSKRTGKRCGQYPTPGRTVCKWHGGAIPRGMALPQYKDGRYSKHLPSRLASAYRTARTDPELLSTRDEIALIEARLQELLTRLNTGDLGTLWPALAAAQRAFTAARVAGQIPEMHAHLAQMEQLIDQGREDWALWQALGQQVDRLARLRQVEHKRLLDLQLVMTQEQANVLLGALVAITMEALKQHIPDEPLVRRIFGEISRGLDAHLGTSGDLN